jgi:bacillolysin
MRYCEEAAVKTKRTLRSRKTGHAIHLPLLLALVSVCILAACQRSKNIWDITEPSTTAGWITFKESANVNPKTAFKDYANLFQLAPGNEMVIVSEEKDELGMVHYRYKQFFKQVPVENAEFIVHAKNNRAMTANGSLAMNFAPSRTTPLISEEQAFRTVKERVLSDRFLREDDLVKNLENMEPSTTQPGYRPKGTLIFAQKPNTDSQEWVLAWMFKAYVLPLERSRQVFVNASDGSVIKELPLFGDCAGAHGDTTFRGNQPFNTKNTNNRFYLTNDCNGNVLNAFLLDSSSKKVDVSDDDNNWNGNNRSLVTSYWALDITYDYFRLVHNRNSYDNKNSNMIIYNDPTIKDKNGNLTPNNANGGGGVIRIGFGSTNSDNDDYNTVDIVGHEFGHSLIETSAKLGYDPNTEAGALNESFSDILGHMVRRWEEKNVNPDWVIGDQKGCTGGAICRDFQNPKNFFQPDTYQGKFWQTKSPTQDIDPHVNGNVQNHWFYLLTDGGTGTNIETGIQYSITGIGNQKSGKIAYRALTQYLNSSTDYKASREGTIRAAEDLYGINSQEVGQVTKAWCAVDLCPYTQPKKPDIFDTTGGNPNPASPNNNNTLAGATPLGTGKYSWSTNTNNPQIKITGLNIYPFNDVDYFKLTLPDIQNPFGGKCVKPGFAFNFTNSVNANIYNHGAVVKTYSNGSYLTVPFQSVTSDFAIGISPAFPGQVLDYDMQITYFLGFDSDCYRDGPKSKWELIRECIMCNFRVLLHGEEFIVDPPYRTKDKVPVQDYYFYHAGESNVVDIPIQIKTGNRLQAQVIDENGNVIASADNIEKTAQGNVLRLRSGRLREGVYSLRFNAFGNGTVIAVSLPGGK